MLVDKPCHLRQRGKNPPDLFISFWKLFFNPVFSKCLRQAPGDVFFVFFFCAAILHFAFCSLLSPDAACLKCSDCGQKTQIIIPLSLLAKALLPDLLGCLPVQYPRSMQSFLLQSCIEAARGSLRAVQSCSLSLQPLVMRYE